MGSNPTFGTNDPTGPNATYFRLITPQHEVMPNSGMDTTPGLEQTQGGDNCVNAL